MTTGTDYSGRVTLKTGACDNVPDRSVLVFEDIQTIVQHSVG